MNVPLKIAIFKSGKSQRQLSIDARMAEGRLSDLVRGRAWPSSTEREALASALGEDFFAQEQMSEVRSRR